MADHPDTWVRIVEMARAQFHGNEPTAQALACATYDTELRGEASASVYAAT
jgi:hypothetical protein